MTKKKRVIISLSDEAFEKLLKLRHKMIASTTPDEYLYTSSEVIEYCLLFGPLTVSK